MSTDKSSDDEPLFDPRITGYNWIAGVLGGVVAFMSSFLLMIAVVLVPDGPGDDSSMGAILGEIGRVTYNAHQMALEIRPTNDDVVILEEGGAINSTQIRPEETVIVNTESNQPYTVIGNNTDNLHVLNFDQIRNPIAYAEAKPDLLYYLVPIVVLLATGAVLAWLTLSADQSLGEAVLPGLAATLGYVGAGVVGTFLVGTELADGALRLAPGLWQTVVFMLVYGLLLSTLGALAVAAYRNREQLRRRIAR